MSEVRLGLYPSADAARDAIHIAVIPAVSKEDLLPGHGVGLLPDGTASRHAKFIGIVDPYLTALIPAGQWFWLCLNPGSVTGMRHHWSHPSFDKNAKYESLELKRSAENSAAKLKAEERLRDFASDVGLSLAELMNAAREYSESGTYLCEGSRYEGVCFPDTFWDDYELFTGETCTDRDSFFSCSC